MLEDKPNLKIEVSGWSNASELEIAKVIGEALKKYGLGQVVFHVEESNDPYKGILRDELVDITINKWI